MLVISKGCRAIPYDSTIAQQGRDLDLVDSQSFLRSIGVQEHEPRTSPFDTGYGVSTLAEHLEQSSHLMASIKLSMACWLVADQKATKRKLDLAREYGVTAVAGGSLFEISAVTGVLDAYLELCADVGFGRIECGEGFTGTDLDAVRTVQAVRSHGLACQYELGGKHSGPLTNQELDSWLKHALDWLEAGAEQVVVEARESARGVGLFDDQGGLNGALADRIAEIVGFSKAVFEAPTKYSQFALLNHFGPEVRLSNVRLEELLRVEIYRKGLHSDAFGEPRLTPSPPSEK